MSEHRAASRQTRSADLLIWAGVLVLLSGGLLWARSALAAAQVAALRFLPATQSLRLPLPEAALAEGRAPLAWATPAAGPSIAYEAPPGASAALTQPPAQAARAQPTEAALAGMPRPTLESGLLAPTVMARPTDVPPTPAATATAAAPPPTPAAPVEAGLPPYSAVVRLLIPALEIDRAVTPVGMRPAASGALEWDTDSLFATRNRSDLVGQLVGSYSPGQGGNILLVGHNSNRIDFGFSGVFAGLKNLRPGERIELFTEDGRRVAYVVEQVRQVPWRTRDEAELEKHLKFMGSTPGERLTLITCGGANLWPFPARIYVTAAPVVE